MVGTYKSDGTREKFPKIYITWAMMKQRCYNPNHEGYKRYGEKGITVCEEWRDNFEQFYLDMNESMEEHLKSFSKTDTSLDRVDNTKGYSKGNCRWVTRKEQSNNTSKNVFLDYNGGIIPLLPFCKLIKRSTHYVRSRINEGYSGDDIANGVAYLKIDSKKEEIRKVLLKKETNKINKRNLEILKKYSISGKKLSDVGDEYNISAERVRQIIKESLNLDFLH